MKNNDEEFLTEGIIFYGPGCCPICFTQLYVVDSELTLMEVNSEGHPVSEDTTIRCEGVCPKCGYKQKMVRWNGGYVPYGVASSIIREMEFKDYCKKRLDELRENGDKNPFKI